MCISFFQERSSVERVDSLCNLDSSFLVSRELSRFFSSIEGKLLLFDFSFLSRGNGSKSFVENFLLKRGKNRSTIDYDYLSIYIFWKKKVIGAAPYDY